MEYEATARKPYTRQRPTVKHIRIEDGTKAARRAARKQLKLTLRTHRNAIKQSKQAIRKHKLLMKQARLTYKVSK